MSFGLLFVAWLSDRMSRKTLALIGTALLIALSWPFFSAAEAHSASLLALFAFAGLVGSICAGTVIAIAADLFPTRIRFSGVALSYNLSFTLFSGLAPVVAALFARNTGVAATAAYYMVGCAALSFAAALVIAPLRRPRSCRPGRPGERPQRLTAAVAACRVDRSRNSRETARENAACQGAMRIS